MQHLKDKYNKEKTAPLRATYLGTLNNPETHYKDFMA